MEDFLTKALLQSGLGVVGVLALLYVIRELTKLETRVAGLDKKVTRIDKRVAVIMAMQQIPDPVTHDDNGD